MPARSRTTAALLTLAGTLAGCALATVLGTGTAAQPTATTTAPAATAVGTGNLAETGSERSLGILASVGATFLLAGATVIAVRRGRRSPGAPAR